MIGQIEITYTILTAPGRDQDHVVALELTKILSVPFIVETKHVGIIPDLTSTQRGESLLFQLNAVHVGFGEDVTHGTTSLDLYVAEVFLKLQYTQSRFWFQDHFNGFRFTVGVCTEIRNARSGLFLCQVILFVARDTGNRKPFDVVGSCLSVAINHVVDGSLIVLLEDIRVENIFANEHFLAYFHHLVLPVFEEDDDVVDV